MTEIPEFNTKKELFQFLVENKSTLEAQKKAVTKECDGMLVLPFNRLSDKKTTTKANEPFIPDNDQFKVRAIINTTNIMDSHYDVHIPGLWNKSLSENKMIMHLQEHVMKFDHIIADSDDLKAYTQNINFSELGYPQFEGETEALTFDSTVKRSRNEFMFDQYAKGYVKNHSVGMRYVRLVLCVNDQDWGAEFEAWEKYFPMVANKSFAESIGYFWAVKEAKVIEGSAVPLGSNFVTPTQENNLKLAPLSSTQANKNKPAPHQSTQEQDSIKTIKEFKFV